MSTYVPTVWVDEDGSGNGTLVTAALMNKIEQALATVVAAAASGGAVPTSVVNGATFSVPANSQVLWSADIDLQGTLDISGTLVEF